MSQTQTQITEGMVSSPTEPRHSVRFCDPVFPGTVRLECSCGAKWSVSNAEFDAVCKAKPGATLYVREHREYAKRTATRQD